MRVFENRLDTFWKDQPVKYNFREELRTWINDLGEEDNCILRPEHTDDDDDDILGRNSKYTVSQKKNVPTYFLLCVGQIWTDVNKNWQACPERNT